MHPIAITTPDISNQFPVQTLQAQAQVQASSISTPGSARPQHLDSWLGLAPDLTRPKLLARLGSTRPPALGPQLLTTILEADLEAPIEAVFKAVDETILKALLKASLATIPALQAI